MVGGGGVEIDVRDEALFAIHDLINQHGHFVPLRLAGLLAHALRHRPEDFGARVAFLVDAVAEAHDAVPVGQRLHQVGFDVVDAADGLEGDHHLLVGAAVQRALEGADGRHHAGIDVRHGRHGGAGGKGGGVDFVIGVEDQGDVEELGELRVGVLSLQHVEEVGGDVGVRLRRQGLLAVADAVEARHQGRHARHHAGGLADVGAG